MASWIVWASIVLALLSYSERPVDAAAGAPGRAAGSSPAPSPVGERAVEAAQVGQLALLVGILLRRLAVELDAQAGRGGRQQVAVAPGRLRRDDVAEGLVGAARLLLHPEVGGGQVQLQAGGGRDGAERVVYRQLDVVGLAPAGDLARLGEAAGDAEVDARVVDPLLLDQLAELPLRAE